jgi:ArsR family transcriptional regulator
VDDTKTTSERIGYLARQMKILADPNRLMIINLLLKGTQCNCMLGDALQIAPNLISHHLGVLREANLVRIERDPIDARWIYYSINREAFVELKKVFGEFFTLPNLTDAQQTCKPELTQLSISKLSISRG